MAKMDGIMGENRDYLMKLIEKFNILIWPALAAIVVFITVVCVVFFFAGRANAYVNPKQLFGDASTGLMTAKKVHSKDWGVTQTYQVQQFELAWAETCREFIGSSHIRTGLSLPVIEKSVPHCPSHRYSKIISGEAAVLALGGMVVGHLMGKLLHKLERDMEARARQRRPQIEHGPSDDDWHRYYQDQSGQITDDQWYRWYSDS